MTKIQWTEETWNPIVGCSVVSPGCTNCYAMRMAWRLAHNPATPQYHGTVEMVNGKPVWTGMINQASDATLTAPLHCGKPTTWFVNSMSDLFHEGILDEEIDLIFAVMALCPQHQFQVLTKRPARMRAYCSTADRSLYLWDVADQLAYENNLSENHPGDNYLRAGNRAAPWPLSNVWLGISAEDQRRADERIPLLLATPAAVRFVSLEPLLGPIDIGRWLAIDWRCSFCREYFSGRHKTICPSCGKEGGWCGSHAFNGRHYPRGPIAPSQRGSGLDWVIAGGESGPGARPCRVEWIRAVVAQCQAASVPVFVKQLGSDPIWNNIEGPLSLVSRKGGDPSEWPADLRIREMPTP